MMVELWIVIITKNSLKHHGHDGDIDIVSGGTQCESSEFQHVDPRFDFTSQLFCRSSKMVLLL